jgi:hypothetical protein
MTKRASRKPRSGFNGSHGDWRSWRDSGGHNDITSPIRMGNNLTSKEAAEKITSQREEVNEDKLDFESLYPLPRLPMVCLLYLFS